MKVLYINIYMHAKNNNSLMNYKNISFFIINHTNIDLIDLTSIHPFSSLKLNSIFGLQE